MESSTQGRHGAGGVAERIRRAARIEFSRRGYHGARVQGIARAASCNVALIYRHWASKRALYVDVLRAVWLAAAGEIAGLVERRPAEPGAVVGAYLDAMLEDPVGAQILVRELLDGAPFFAQLAAGEPSVLDPARRAASALVPRVDGADAHPIVSVLAVGALAALVATARDAVQPFLSAPIPPEIWRRRALDLLVNGLAPPGADGGRSAGAA